MPHAAEASIARWIALFPDAHPGYIDWQTYETNQRLLLANATAHGEDRAVSPAPRRHGPAAGPDDLRALRRRMAVRYHTRRGA